jgi:hypothetical protein
MKLWLDDVRPAPEGYVWCRSVNEAKAEIKHIEGSIYIGENEVIDLIDLDYDSGDYEADGGPYIKLMDWLVETNRMYPLTFHSQNSVGLAAMKRMYRRYWLKEIL